MGDKKVAALDAVDLAALLPLVMRGVVALESISAALTKLSGYVETNGVPGSLFERAQRALGTAKTVRAVVRIYRATHLAVGPGERAALLAACAGMAAGLSNPSRASREAWGRFVVEGCNERDAAIEDATVARLAEAARNAAPSEVEPPAAAVPS